jgi:nitroreductase
LGTTPGEPVPSFDLKKIVVGEQTVDAMEAMRTARAIRRFTSEPVDHDVLRQCLEAATWAPSGGNRQPWRFVVLESRSARAALADGAHASWETITSLYDMTPPDPGDDSSRARSTRFVTDLHAKATEVPCAVLFAVEPNPVTPPLLQGASIYPAMQNFIIAARVHGLGAVVTGWGSRVDQRLRHELSIPPDWEIAAVVAVGWPVGRHGPVRRRPLGEVAALDDWNTPFPAS